MNWKKKRLKNCRLCAVINRPFFKNIPDLAAQTRLIAASGAGMIQLRDKDSDKKDILEAALLLKKKLAGTGVIFMINDHVDIAALSRADGVHLGQSDLPLAAARKLLGRDKVIGISCVNLRQALEAQEEGADYIGVGPVFPTGTKIDCPAPLGLKFLASVTNKISIPIFAIGGINEMNISRVLSSGADGVAVSSAICCAADKIAVTRRFTKILDSYDAVRTG